MYLQRLRVVGCERKSREEAQMPKTEENKESSRFRLYQAILLLAAALLIAIALWGPLGD